MTFRLATADEIFRISDRFIVEHGDSPQGLIPDGEFDLLFDCLAAVLSKFGTFSEEATFGSNPDFNGCRYVDQIPCITIVPGREVEPEIAIAAALEAIAKAHRPLAVIFDYHPEYVMALPGEVVSIIAFRPIDE